MASELTIKNLETLIEKQRELNFKNPDLKPEDRDSLSKKYTILLEKYKSYPNKEKFGKYLKNEIEEMAKMIGRQTKITENIKYLWKAYRNIEDEFGL